jgi:V/A-type H+-transporting ATPase subunit D
MAKIKLTKNELKKQKDSLKMFRRYLPTLMLKKQQLQAEIRTVELRIREREDERDRLVQVFQAWIAVFGEAGVFTPGVLRITGVKTAAGNIAGVSSPLVEGANFAVEAYDLVRTPLWLDAAVDRMKQMLLLDLEIETLAEQRRRLDHELRVTTQRVNLFEKIKIPETRGNIKKIQVYLGDQQTSAVVRGKIAKRGLARAAQGMNASRGVAP